MAKQVVWAACTVAFFTSARLGELSALLPDFCVPGEDSISCHSFRAGIPSTLALFPDLAKTDDIKGWGRWHSDCFNRYTRLHHDQKKAIFDKITAAILTASQPDFRAA
jgi:hypothetical protein